MVDLLVFSAAYCGPCRQMEAAGVYQAVRDAGYEVTKVDTQKDPAMANQYGVRAIPTMVVRKNGQTAKTLVGAMPAATIIAELQRHEG